METPTRRLAEAAKRRREELGISQQRVAEQATAAGHELSYNTYRNIEGAKFKAPRPPSLAALDAGLKWPPGTAAGIVHGPGMSDDAPVVLNTDHDAVMVLLDCLTANQRTVVFRAVREWVDDHPEYAEHLGVQIALGDLDITPDELASLGDFLSGLARRRETA